MAATATCAFCFVQAAWVVLVRIKELGALTGSNPGSKPQEAVLHHNVLRESRSQQAARIAWAVAG